VNQVRGQGNPVVLVDGGDCFFSSPSKQAPSRAEAADDLRTARTILNAYNLLGYQALGLGPADLQLGIDTLRSLQKEARFPFLSANIVDRKTRQPIFQPYVVIQTAGVRLGIYSVVTSGLNETYSKRVLPEADILDPAETTKRIVAELRSKADLVIGLSQLDVDLNEKLIDAKLGIDVLIDPLSKNGTKALWVDEGQYCTTRAGTPILRVDGQGSRVGVFEMYFKSTSPHMEAFRGYDAPLEPHIQRHPEMTKLLLDGRSDAFVLPTGLDAAKPRLIDDFLGSEGCGACHEEQLDFWKRTKHVSAFSTLVKSGDEARPECVVCHSYGYGVTFADVRVPERFRDVQCESCHGFKAAHAENPKLSRLGTVSEDACWGCHNPALTQKNFVPSLVKESVSCPKMKR
jgi:hypothetical protein